MTLEQERLSSLIEFAKETARLRSKLVTDVKQHNIFLARHYFSRKLKWNPSDFSGEKSRGD